MEMDEEDLIQQLESDHQNNTEVPQPFAIQILALNNCIALESKESWLSERCVLFGAYSTSPRLLFYGKKFPPSKP